MRCALRTALSSVIWSDLASRDEKITATETIIQQFSDAYMAFIPAYLDMLTEMYGGMEMWNQKRFEVKAGAMISAANKATIQAACKSISDGHQALLALVTDDAGTTTSSEKAADPAKPEPVSHSAISQKIDELKGILAWN